MIRVRIQNRQNSFPVTGAMKRLIKNSIRTALKCEGYADGEVSVLLCSGLPKCGRADRCTVLPGG